MGGAVQPTHPAYPALSLPGSLLPPSVSAEGVLLSLFPAAPPRLFYLSTWTLQEAGTPWLFWLKSGQFPFCLVQLKQGWNFSKGSLLGK